MSPRCRCLGASHGPSCPLLDYDPEPVGASLSDLRDIAPRPTPTPPGPIARPAPRLKKPPQPIKPRNEKRARERQAEAFGEQAAVCRRRACLVLGCRMRPSVPHHALSRGARGSDEHTVPLCWVHHEEAHHGQKTFEERHGLDLLAAAKALAAELAARPAHDCEAFAVLRENTATLDSRYVCGRCAAPIPDEQEDDEA
jgi:hypothetical protein